MQVAVVGGGLFGCTTAIHLQRAGHSVHLYEKDKLLHGATFGSYMRLHRGYHYPRSPETGRESLKAEASFREEYGKAVVDGGSQSYVVAAGGHITPWDYAVFLDGMRLPYERDGDTFRVIEPRINYGILSSIIRDKLTGIGLRFEPFHSRNQYDAIVVAAYAGTNGVLRQLGVECEPYKFQVVEKPIVKLPDDFRDTSVVVIDGPFGCLDPVDEIGYHALGHVVHTVLDERVSLDPPQVKYESRFRTVRDALSQYVPGVKDAQYIGSVWTTRAVLPGQEKTDARPTLVQRLDDKVIRVFSGKMGTAVAAARDVVAMVRGMESKRAA